MLRIEARNAETPIERKPEWIRTRATMGPEYTELKGLVKREGLNTVCEEAGCPTSSSAGRTARPRSSSAATSARGAATSARSTRASRPTFDADEPRRVAASVQAMGLKYSTVTGVARDDLPDGGAWLYAETVRQIHAVNPGTGVELLIPDFNATPSCSTRSSRRSPRSWRTTSRPCRASSRRSAPASATTGRSP